MKRRMLMLVPLGLLLALVLLLAAGLRKDPRSLPSALVGRPAPEFVLPGVAEPTRSLSPSQWRGRPFVMNVWASWGAACRDDHALLLELARRDVPLYGLNYKDDPKAALDWLRRAGDPYRASAADAQGRAGMDYGVYGVPETFVVDGRGIVRFRHAGPLTPTIVERELMPLLKELGL
jgi:cytochrome c biogenesis protein CcmG/thiol:disulfide interchange protein DsbE